MQVHYVEYWLLTIATSRHAKKAFVHNEISLLNPVDYIFNRHFKDSDCDICILFAIKLSCASEEYKKIETNWNVFNSVYFSDEQNVPSLSKGVNFGCICPTLWGSCYLPSQAQALQAQASQE